MKKAIGVTLLSCMMLLTACGNSEENKKETSQETTSQVEEAGAKQEKCDLEVAEGCINYLGRYSNDETDKDGVNTIDFNGFKLGYVPMLVDIKLNEEGQMQEKYKGQSEVKAIMIHMEAENTLEDDVDYSNSFVVVTDTGEQLNSESGLASSNEVSQTYFGKVAQTGYDILPLEKNEIPKSFKFIIDPPNKLVDGAYNGNEDLGGERRVEFNSFKKE